MKRKARSKKKKAAKAVEVIVRYSGIFRRFPATVAGDAEHMKVILRRADGKEKVLFRGRNFSDKEFQKIKESLR